MTTVLKVSSQDGKIISLSLIDNGDGTFSLPVSLGAAPAIDIGDVQLLAGEEIIGKVGIDQTTDGTTNKVSLGSDVVSVSISGGEGGGLTDTQLRADAVSVDINKENKLIEDTLGVSLFGSPTGDLAGVAILDELVNDGSGFALNTRVANPPKLDANNAAMISDGPAPIQFWCNENHPKTFDMLGYQWLSVQVNSPVAGGNLQVYSSNDGINYVQSSASMGGGNWFHTNANGGNASCFIVLATHRYIQLRQATAETLYGIAYMRGGPAPFHLASNIATVGTAPISLVAAGATTVGAMPVSGVNAVAIAPSATNPVTIGGQDSGEVKLSTAFTGIVPVPLTRRILTDVNGKLRIAAENSFTSQGGTVLSVTDQSENDGRSQIEILALVLQEIRVLNLQMYRLLELQNDGPNGIDEPESLRDILQ